MEQSLKCLHCGHEYTMQIKPKQEILERVCPKCKSNSVRKHLVNVRLISMTSSGTGCWS